MHVLVCVIKYFNCEFKFVIAISIKSSHFKILWCSTYYILPSV